MKKLTQEKRQSIKPTLTIEQSSELIKRGVCSDKASVKCPIDAPYRTSGVYIASVFTLADLLSLLPKKIDDTYCLKIQSCDWPAWAICYVDSQSGAKGWCQSMELIDALYELLLWAIDHNHVKLD